MGWHILYISKSSWIVSWSARMRNRGVSWDVRVNQLRCNSWRDVKSPFRSVLKAAEVTFEELIANSKIMVVCSCKVKALLKRADLWVEMLELKEEAKGLWNFRLSWPSAEADEIKAAEGLLWSFLANKSCKGCVYIHIYPWGLTNTWHLNTESSWTHMSACTCL